MAELDIEKIVASISYQVNNDMEDFIVRVVNDYNMDSSIVVNAKKITEALEKQIPIEHYHTKVYEIKDSIRLSICPKCLYGTYSAKFEYPKYCSWCGQKIDWETDF